MVGLTLSKFNKQIFMILLTSCFSFGHCKKEISTSNLICNIETLPKTVDGTADVGEISAVNACPKDYENVTIIKKCENLIISNPTASNTTMYEPVTNSFKNIIYWNVYCAICNYENESDLEYWPAWSKLGYFDGLCQQYAWEMRTNFDVNEMTRDSIRQGLKLISTSIDSDKELRCSIKEKWPMNLLMYVVPCLKDRFLDRRKTRLDSCQYFNKNGRICLQMEFIVEGIHFAVDENGKILLFDKSSIDKFPPEGYSIENGIDNVIYQCVKNEENYPVFEWVEIIAINVSIIFIVVYLVINFNEKYFQRFPNKITYSYSVGLLVMYLLELFIYVLFSNSCMLGALNLFTVLFHFFWTMIIAFEFCRLTYYTIRKRKISVIAQPKRYLVYCVLGYAIPVAIPVIYFLILETDGNRCPQIPDHFGVPCLPANNSTAEYFYDCLVFLHYRSFLILVPTLLVLQSCVLIYITKCGPKLSTRIRSNVNRNHVCVLIKMAYIMGAHWMLYAAVFWINSKFEKEVLLEIGAAVPFLFADFQGVFVFFAFTFKKSMLDGILRMCKCRGRDVQQSTSISGATTTTVQYQSSSGQLKDSTETMK